MTKPTHTPGPWQARKHSVLTKAGRMICTGSVGDAECSQNLRLIALCPELLEALYSVIDALVTLQDEYLTKDFRAKFAAQAYTKGVRAISKAEGRS